MLARNTTMSMNAISGGHSSDSLSPIPAFDAAIPMKVSIETKQTAMPSTMRISQKYQGLNWVRMARMIS